MKLRGASLDCRVLKKKKHDLRFAFHDISTDMYLNHPKSIFDLGVYLGTSYIHWYMYAVNFCMSVANVHTLSSPHCTYFYNPIAHEDDHQHVGATWGLVHRGLMRPPDSLRDSLKGFLKGARIWWKWVFLGCLMEIITWYVHLIMIQTWVRYNGVCRGTPKDSHFMGQTMINHQNLRYPIFKQNHMAFEMNDQENRRYFQYLPIHPDLMIGISYIQYKSGVLEVA